MAAAYSMDLRTRVLRDSDGGLSSKELAERYHVSRARVDALKQRKNRRESHQLSWRGDRVVANHSRTVRSVEHTAKPCPRSEVAQ